MKHKQYLELLNESLCKVIHGVLKKASQQGLAEDQSFFISFFTAAKSVGMPDLLKVKYPKEMTIILQYQFDNLKVTNKYFSVDLSFDGVKQTLKIPFISIKYFSDPSANFSMYMHSPYSIAPEVKDNSTTSSDGFKNIISLDNFRKSKNNL